MQRPLTTKDAVWQTLCWFDTFGQPATAAEVHQYLFYRRATLTSVTRALRADNRVVERDGYYHLAKRRGLVQQRAAHAAHAAMLWQVVERYRWIFRVVPCVRLVAVGNTLAMGWPESDSDIDLFVVAQRNRLFLARTCFTLVTTLAGIRRHGRRVAGRFCLSFFAEERALNLEKVKIDGDDPYLAFWLATLVPMWGSDRTLWARNAWIRAYFSNLPAPAYQPDTRQSWAQRAANWMLSGTLGDWLEDALASWQLRRAASKKQNTTKNAVIISRRMLKFHESDQRTHYRSKWQERVTR